MVYKKDHAVLIISKQRGDERRSWRVIIDAEDAEAVRSKIWRMCRKGYPSHWSEEAGERIFFMLHRWIMDPKDGEFIDHANHDLLDNRKSNLVTCDTKSCIYSNSIRACHQVHGACHNVRNRYYVEYRRPGKRPLVLARCDSCQRAKKLAKEIRDGEKPYVDYLIEAEIKGKSSPLHHIRKLGIGFSVYGKTGYIGYAPNLQTAIVMRNEALKLWAKEVISEN